MQLPPDLRPARLNALGAFAASIAHEVKQPLAAVKLHAEACLALLEHDPPRIDDARAALRVLMQASVTAGDLLRSLHGMACRAEPAPRLFDIDDAVREVLQLTRAQLRQHGIALHEHYGLDGCQLQADRVQLMQVIMNLVLNAIEARPRTLTLRTTLRHGAVRIVVADDGAGIPAGLAGSIYEPLFSTKPGGTGMGLAICRSIVQAHGGRLWHSGSAGNTAFHLSFKEYTLWTPSRS
ncbi:ATP-binding protein [Duganella sp.]|uniref:sensor histidine kinase n=1 Tax=Duganella sp. TaxID=1904440 RepID=UPI0031D171C2